MSNSQWENTHDEKAAKGGLRHHNLLGSIDKAGPPHKAEWFFDVFLGEYRNIIGLSTVNVVISARASTLLKLNVGPINFTVEYWRAKGDEGYG
jgi:hypothetical protein